MVHLKQLHGIIVNIGTTPALLTGTNPLSDIFSENGYNPTSSRLNWIFFFKMGITLYQKLVTFSIS